MAIKEKFTEAKEAMSKEARVARHEEMGYKSAGSGLKHGYIANHPKAIQKAKSKCGTPDQFEKMYREFVFDQGGEDLAQRTLDTIIHGKDYIRNMKNYQRHISDYTVYAMALQMKDTGRKPSQDIILDELAERINSAAEDFGFSNLPYTISEDEDGDPVYEDKLLINPSIIDEIDTSNYTPEQKAEVEKKIKQYKANQEANPLPTGKDLFKDIDGRVEIMDEPPAEPAGAEKKEKDIKRTDKDKSIDLEDVQKELDTKSKDKAESNDKKAIKKAEKEAKKAERKAKKENEEEAAAEPTKSDEPKDIIDVETKIIKAEETVKEEVKEATEKVKETLKDTVDPFTDLVQDIVDTASAEAKSAQKEGAKSTK